MPRSFACPFFKAWSPDMAYVLGYWFADGGMRSRAVGGPEVYFVSNDRDHLELVAKVVGVGTIRRVSRFRDGYRLNMSRRQIYDDLTHLGGTQQKSLNATWPQIPWQFVADFVRGYLDGDGWIGWQAHKNYPLPAIGLYGTQAFIMGMAAAIEEQTGLRIPTCHTHHGTWGVSWYGIYAKCLTIWLYQNEYGLAMQRKAVVVPDIIRWKPQKFYKDGITSKMWELFGAFIP